jgi:thiol-disulfide isomerase/thioredoxin
MNKKIVIVLVPVILLACNFLFPPESVVTPPTKPASQPSDDQILTKTGFTVVRLHPEDGDLQTMLAAEAQQAAALGQMPVVEFDATWCPPCQAIEAALNSKNELMLKAYEGTYIIKLDVDEWEWDDGRVQNFVFEFIPVYFKLDAKGKQTGEVIDGGAWGEDIPENIAPVMDEFFHGG